MAGETDSRLKFSAIAATALCVIAMVAVLAGPEHSAATSPSDPLVFCDYSPFPYSIFDKPAGAENAGTPEAAALLRVVRGKNPDSEGLYVPKHGWRLTYETPNRIEFLAGKPKADGNVYVTFDLENGHWRFDQYSSICAVRPYNPHVLAGEWRIRSKRNPEAEATSIPIYVYEESCANGQPPGKRLRGPVISYGPDTVTVTYFIKPFRIATCQGVPPGRTVLKLSEPLGDRVLVDGGVYPNPTRKAGEVDPHGYPKR